ncbi:hypothetical protein GCM10007941_30110 [Amphritea balenae]|nr:hypothetical protein GCM10007941_30110 [Amphritea balenae]
MPVNSWDSDHLDIPERHLKFSEAYLHSARVLCENLVRLPASETFETGCACLFNARLAVELFLKAALLKKDPNIRLHHVIEELRDEYNKHYPESEFFWDIPFTVEILGARSQEEKEVMHREHLKSYPQDQVLRYPMNRQREPWEAAAQFSAPAFLINLDTIEADFQRIRGVIFN